MNDYKRFVSYIYNYEMKIKKNNIGFARVETKGNQCKITVHMQAKSLSNQSVKLYGFSRDEVNLVVIPLGDIIFKNGSGDGQVLTSVDHFGDSSIGLEQIGGLILYLSDDKYFGTEWDDKPLVFKELRLLENVEKSRKENEDGAPDKILEAAEIKVEETPAECQDSIDHTPSTAQIREDWQNRIAKSAAPVEQNIVAEQTIHAVVQPEVETVVSAALPAFFEAYTLTDILERFSYAVTDNFMLHGFYRFGHLGVMNKNNKFILGVPGIFCKREEMVANRSGFHNFYPKNGGNLHYGDFGYWYTSIEYLK